MDKEILTVEEAAAFLQKIRRSLYKLAREGKVPGKMVMKTWKLEKEALKRWVSEGQGE